MANFQSQYNALSSQLNQLESSGMQDSQMYRTLRSQRDALVPQMGQAAGGTAGGAGGVGTAASNWQNALNMTQGRGDAVMGDPYTQAALNRFQSVLGGQDVPYTQQVQNQLLARQADAGAASGAAQASMLRDSMAALDGSMADPQAQAAMRQIQAQLQQQNNANLGDMQSKATMANFGAKNDAASNLAATRAGQLGMANSQYNQASQLYANQSLAGQHVNATSNVQPPVQQGQSGPTDYERQMQAYQESLKAWKAAQQGQQQTSGGNNQQPNTGGGYFSNGMTPLAGVPYAGPGGGPGPTMQVGGSGNWTGNTNGNTYQNGVNTATGVPMGTGYVQLHDQPNTRINYSGAASQYGVYNPQLPVY